MKVNNNKKGSNARKLIPAVGMLSVSAVMLATSTYAWFTMSREVEVTGIKLTATVPENIEISLGYDQHTGNHLAKAAAQPTTYDGYNASTGWLQLVKAPENSVDSQDWSNSVAFCNFYDVGKLLPASSTDGVSIFYTGNAVNTGENVSDTSTFTLANNFTNNKLAQTTTLLKNEGAAYYAGAFTSSAFDPDKAKTGYYVDFPIWIRTSSDSEINLVVDATISDGDTASETLYRAARVAILNADGTVVTSTNEVTASGWATKQGLLYDDYSSNDYTLDTTLTRPYTVASTVDGSGNVTTINYTPYAASSALTTRLVANSTNAVAANYQDTLRYFNRYTGITGNQAVASAGTADASHAVNTFYDAITRFTQATKDSTTTSGYAETGTTTKLVSGQVAVVVPGAKTAKTSLNGSSNYIDAPSDGTYGAAVKKIVRVWLEGEDINCWNATAGQDFEIALRFINQNGVSDVTNQQKQSKVETVSKPASVTATVDDSGSITYSATLPTEGVASYKIGTEATTYTSKADLETALAAKVAGDYTINITYTS